MTLFAQNLKHLRKKSSKTQEQLGNEINLGRTTIANYEAGASNPTDPDVLVKLSHLFQVSIDELLTRDLSLAFASGQTGMQVPSDLEGREPVAYFIANKKILYETSIKMNHPLVMPKVIVVDSKGEEKIVFVSKEKVDTYLEKGEDPAFVGSLPLYSFPNHPEITHRIFEINGNAMEPRFSHTDKVVAKWISNVEDIKDGSVYVIVSKRTGLMVRRVLNKIHDRNGLQLIADTVQYSNQYPLLELPLNELEEIWSVEFLITSNFAPPVENMFGKIANLELKVQEIMKNLTQQNPK